MCGCDPAHRDVAGGHQQAGGEFHVSLEPFLRESLRQERQVHLYSGTPGRTVWAQSRQTNRPSLWAIIGLNSMPMTQ
jgi:hypothetical protein